MAATTGKSEKLHFQPSPEPSLGVEVELQILDRDSGDLAPGAVRILKACQEDSLAGTSAELKRPRARPGDIRRHWIAVENKWLATRHGLQAMYIRTPSGKRRALAHDLGELLERLLPTARELGDEQPLTRLKPVDRIETGAARQRRLYREKGNWKALVDEIAAQLRGDLEHLN